MAVVNTNIAQTSAPTRGIGELIKVVRTRASSYWMYRKTLKELSNLTDHQLADLGLHRSGLRRIAIDAAKRA